MKLNKIPRPEDQISHEQCSLKIIKTCKISGKINVTVRLVKTPPASPHSFPLLTSYKSTPIIEIPNSSLLKINDSIKYSMAAQDPSDFIEPPQNLAIPSLQEYMKHASELEDLFRVKRIASRAKIIH